MHSATRQHVPFDKIEILCKKTFSCKPVEAVEMEEGFSNAIYSILLENGKRVILKVAPPRHVRVMNHEKNIMYTEITMLQKMKNYTSIQVPSMYYYDAAETVVPSSYFFMEYLDGDNLHDVRKNLSREVQNTIDEELGRNNRLINSIHGVKFGYYGQRDRQRDSWYEAFRVMMEDILEDCRYYSIDLQYEPETFLTLLESSKACFDEVKTPCLVHWDLWDGNVFVKDGKVQGIIDWERSLWADPLMEDGFRTHHHNEAFYRGYGIKPFTTTEELRIRWYDLYLCLTWLAEYSCRDYQDERYYSSMWKQYHDAVEHLNMHML
jgi:aminoglycoside phosphotransferase (APT) family kinase protein